MTDQEIELLPALKNILSWSKPGAGESAEQTLARVQYNIRAVILSMSKETIPEGLNANRPSDELTS